MTDFANGTFDDIIFRMYLTGTSTAATGKTVAVTVSKNHAAFGNPAAGASNATEIGNGYYYYTPTGADTTTNGAIIWYATNADCDSDGVEHRIVPATNGRLSALPATACTTNASLITSGTGTAQLNVSSGHVVTVDTLTTYTGNTVQTGDSFARIGVAGAGLTNIDLPNQTMDIVGNITGNLSGSVGSVTGAVTVGTINSTASNLKKNTALSAFEFVMTDSTTHALKTGVTVTATRSLDGAAFGACANSATEVAFGVYTIDLAAADMNANVVTLRFTGTAADDTMITLVTQP